MKVVQRRDHIRMIGSYLGIFASTAATGSGAALAVLPSGVAAPRIKWRKPAYLAGPARARASSP